MNNSHIIGSLLLLAVAARAQQVLVEAESFADHGGWKLDTQFIHTMGSPYLLAHGLGRPVDDARTTVTFPARGRYRVHVRTMDWVARWSAPGAPGRFQLLIDGQPLSKTFGTDGADWGWQGGGVADIDDLRAELRLRDLTGFDGRCDAIVFSRDHDFTPPNEAADLLAWRRSTLGLPEKNATRGPYDLVVVGGGYAGVAASLAAARLGCKVALIQNRPVLGGNGSSEIRVWAKGKTRRGLYPRLGEIVEEFGDRATASPGTASEFGDAGKEALVRAEKNIDLFLEHHADAVVMDGDRMVAIEAFDVRSSERKRFTGRVFADCTGHAVIGVLAGADHSVRERGHLGMSNMWRWDNGAEPHAFPPTPWALELEVGQFPYPRAGKGEWFWESGFDRHPIDDLEYIRDWNLRAVFGAFQAMKSGEQGEKHEGARLVWVAHIGGTRESRQLLGDVVLNRDHIVSKREFRDGCVPTTWDIDLHYPKEEYAEKYPDDPFISRAHFDRSVDKERGYPVPYRCFYSRNIENLFMAGRCISVTHEALGTVRVMRTGGMMGEVIGKAASVCAVHDCEPRDVYEHHWIELQELMRLPGRARRDSPGAAIEIPPLATGPGGVPLDSVRGTVFDDESAKLTGDWATSTHWQGFVGAHYLHDDNTGKGEKSVKFVVSAAESGSYRLEMTWRHDTSRAARVPVDIRYRGKRRTVHVDQRQAPKGADGFETLESMRLERGEQVEVVVSNAKTKGHVIVDALRLMAVDGGRK